MQSCNEKLSDLHTLCLKDTLHKSSPCACTWRQRDVALVTALPGAGTHHRIFPASYAQIPSIWDGLCGSGTPTHILCKSPAEISWVPTPCSPSPAPSPPGAAFSKVCPSLCPLQPLCPISYSSCLHFQWYQVASLPISPGHVMFPDVSRPLHLS